MKCKNIDCHNETTGKRIYCSLTCRNYYVNKYIRDYTKIKETLKNNYLDNYIPKKCKLEKCNEDIPYDNRSSEYCSKGCSGLNVNKNRKGIKHDMSKMIENNTKVYYLNPKKCKMCNNILLYNDRNLKYCSNECRVQYRRKDANLLRCYRIDCNFKFSLNDYPDEFDFSLIEKYGWYSPTNKKNNLDGVSRDHMFSIKEGFEQGIDPKLLSHPANCKLMIHNENVSKNKTSSISIIELLQRIETFDKKYKY